MALAISQAHSQIKYVLTLLPYVDTDIFLGHSIDPIFKTMFYFYFFTFKYLVLLLLAHLVHQDDWSLKEIHDTKFVYSLVQK